MEETKKCIICGEIKSFSAFYKHKAMTNGRTNKCKDCTKKGVELRRKEKMKDPDWVEKEKARHREKYRRLGYKNNTRPPEERKETIRRHKEKFPEKYKAKCRCTMIVTPKGMEKHHWSYNDAHHKDVIFLTIKQHNTIHRYLVYDQEKKMYRTMLGILLDTRLKHEKFIKNII